VAYIFTAPICCSNYSRTLCIKCWVLYPDLIKFPYFADPTERGVCGWPRQGDLMGKLYYLSFFAKCNLHCHWNQIYFLLFPIQQTPCQRSQRSALFLMIMSIWVLFRSLSTRNYSTSLISVFTPKGMPSNFERCSYGITTPCESGLSHSILEWILIEEGFRGISKRMLLLRTFVVWAWFYYNGISEGLEISEDHDTRFLLIWAKEIVNWQELILKSFPV